MEIKLHNTLSGEKEVFKPIHSGTVSMYHCGPTVYNFAHIGNLRSYVFADTLRRVFEYFGFEIKQVVNITDVGHLVGDGDEGEDKVLQTAKKEGKTAKEIALFYEEAFKKDLENLNIETKGTEFPRASEHIKEQLEIINILLEKDLTYKTSDGIYFDTSKFSEYGKLGNINIGGLREGARVEANTEKKNLTDFALWKFSPSESSGQAKRMQEWESPYETGFPGWHIECSAMSRKYLGQPFDIHTGGIDHIPVHHNNEIAQSEGAFETPLANFWIHNEFIVVNKEKMSKSLGNIFTLADLKEHGIHPLSYRYWLLTGNYRTPMNFTWEAVEGAQVALEKIVNDYYELSSSDESDEELLKRFEEAIADNLNTPAVIALLQKAKSKNAIDKMDKVFGLNIKELSEKINDIPSNILDLLKERNEARKAEDWKKSDDLRDKIESKGFRLKDSAEKTFISRSISSVG